MEIDNGRRAASFAFEVEFVASDIEQTFLGARGRVRRTEARECTHATVATQFGPFMGVEVGPASPEPDKQCGVPSNAMTDLILPAARHRHLAEVQRDAT
jgi:hypothetical protein